MKEEQSQHTITSKELDDRSRDRLIDECILKNDILIAALEKQFIEQESLLQALDLMQKPNKSSCLKIVYSKSRVKIS